ncbi:hypothetical protein [Pseudomonas batumici]|uniref:hypothetical protein n=1 Tax=Pseudomonas batumici TaxID=226910 RepID=UPI0012EE01C3|nr:hypothetical protein [Pseudomonas batumici]
MTTFPWQVEALRFSFINLVPGSDSDSFRWSSLIPAEPDSVTTKKAHGILAEQGSWLKGTLAVNRQPGRVDVIYTINQPESFLVLENPLPNAGSFEEVVAACAGFAKPLGSLSASRIAFGAVLLLPVEKTADGYEYLRKFLPFIKLEEDMSDFFLQINRRRNSDLGVQINELTKWGCVDVRGVNIVDPDMRTPGVFAVRLELDINTPESPTPLELDVSKLILELMGRGSSIAQNGAV